MTKKLLAPSPRVPPAITSSLLEETSELSSLFDAVDPKAAAADLSVVQVFTRLKLAVEESGLKQREIAARLNVKPSVVSRWLSGKQNIGARALAEIAWAIDFELDMDFINANGVRVSDLRTCARLEYFVNFSVAMNDPAKVTQIKQLPKVGHFVELPVLENTELVKSDV